MAKKQTRRSISFRAEVFERMRRFCERNDVAMSAWVEAQITSELDARGEPTVAREEALEQINRKPVEPARHPGSFFTW